MNSNNLHAISVRNNLDEVSFIRPILIILLVLYHSLCIHTGNWEPIGAEKIIPFYKELGVLAYSFMLESFVFVSGYVWAYQREGKGRKENLWNLTVKKGLRLIVPTLLFGLLYIFLLEKDNFSVVHLIEGPGHLWFLPMLFWCFVIGWCILQFKISSIIVLTVLFIVSILRPVCLPLRLSYTLYFLFFFFLGYYVYGYYDRIKENIKGWHLLVAWGLFFLAYGGSHIVNSNWSIGWRGGQFCTLVYATIGAMALFLTAVFVTKRRKLKRWYVNLGALCMGVYIFQQFILKGLYYHTAISSRVSNWSLPIIAFTITLLASLILTYIFRLSRIGKKIL